uniref:protein FAM98A-like isoform X2 n=1 Tax=Pristiophorus japonicus TaxID=55135 RepID=UPI00398E9F75
MYWGRSEPWGPEDSETFQLEISGLVSELQCPYQSLTTGNVTSRLDIRESCVQLLLFLGSELQAARVLHARQSSRAPRQVPRADCDDEVFGELRALCQALGTAEPARDVPLSQLFTDLEAKIREATCRLPPTGVGKPLLSCRLEPGQWEHLEVIHRAMGVEYECRRQMLISRLDVTVQSFHWSERAQQRGAEMQQLYEPLRRALSATTSITLGHLLSAREDLSVITKTTCRSNREKTACAVNKILMGPVPDRGGRPSELEAPMPAWESRRSGGGGGGGGGRRQKWGGKGRKHKPS